MNGVVDAMENPFDCIFGVSDEIPQPDTFKQPGSRSSAGRGNKRSHHHRHRRQHNQEEKADHYHHA